MRKLLFALLLLPVLSFAQGTATNIRNGASLPTACANGDIFYKTTAPIGVRECSVPGNPGTWRQLYGATTGASGSDGYINFASSGAFASDSRIQFDVATGTFTVGDGTTQGLVKLFDGATHYVGLKSPTSVTSYTWLFPAADASGCLKSNGSGTLSIGSCGSGTVTHTGGALTSGSLVVGGGTDDVEVLASDPTQCTGGQVPTGVDKTGAAKGCFTPSGSGAPTTALYVTGAYDGTLSAEHSNTTAYYSPDVNPSSAGSIDYECDEATFNNGSVWTWTNQGSATATNLNGWCILVDPSHSSHSWKILTQPKPSGNWTVVAKFTGDMYPLGSSQHSVGLCVRDSSSSKFTTFQLLDTSGAITLELDNWTNATTYSATATSGGFTPTLPLWFKLADDGTNFVWSYSRDGNAYTQYASVGRTSFLAAPDQVGVCWETTNSSVATTMTVDYFRRIN
jgi:hypothetical protein